MADGAKKLGEEHNLLAQAWIQAEQDRMKILDKLLDGYAEKCPSDYDENFFGEYQAALDKATLAGRAYSRWLAEQGIPFR